MLNSNCALAQLLLSLRLQLGRWRVHTILVGRRNLALKKTNARHVLLNRLYPPGTRLNPLSNGRPAARFKQTAFASATSRPTTFCRCVQTSRACNASYALRLPLVALSV